MYGIATLELLLMPLSFFYGLGEVQHLRVCGSHNQVGFPPS